MPLKIPKKLIEKYQDPKFGLVLFAGAGVSCPELPLWGKLLTDMLQDAIDYDLAPEPADIERIQQLIGEKKLLIAAAALKSKLKDNHFNQYFRKTFQSPAKGPNRKHDLIAQAGFRSILTTNFDKLLESAWNKVTGIAPTKYTHTREEALADLAATGQFAVVKVHGDIDDIEDLVLTKHDYCRLIYNNTGLKSFLHSQFSTRSILFLGCSLTDPDMLQFLDWLRSISGSKTSEHFALMKTHGMNAIEKDDFQSTYGINIFGDDASDDHPDIEAFLTELLTHKPTAKATPAPALPLPDKHEIEELLAAHGYLINRCTPGDGFYLFEIQYAANRTRVQGWVIAMAAVPTQPQLQALRDLWQSAHKQIGQPILLIPDGDTPSMQDAARTLQFTTYTRSQFTDRIFDCTAYRNKLQLEYASGAAAKGFVELDVTGETATGASEPPQPLDRYLSQWLADPNVRLLAILGDFGMGKTWLCERLASGQPMSADLLPILIRLRDARGGNLDAAINEAIAKIGMSKPAFDCLRKQGRLLLILDGFDEMGRNTLVSGSGVANFTLIEGLLSNNPDGKILVTCRSAYFKSSTEEKNVVGVQYEPQEKDRIDFHGKEDRRLALLNPFDEPRIRTALQHVFEGQAESRWQEIFDNAQVLELAARPMTAAVLALVLPEIWGKGTAGALNLAILYEEWIAHMLRRQARDDAGILSEEQRRTFMEDLAWQMQRNGRKDIHFEEFPPKIRQQFQVEDTEELETRLQSGGYLTRHGGDVFHFAHYSLQEFLVARRLLEQLRTNSAPADMPLTNAIARFVHYLALNLDLYQIQEEDGMVKVPAGQFLYGQEPDGPRVVAIEKDFEIDRYPVTNQDFCAFLNDVKNTRQKELAEWVHHERSRIKKSGNEFEIEPGFERHPVVGISWHAATAYAKEMKKQLPTEQQWEKAARGIDGRQYPWGEEFDSKKCNTEESGRKKTQTTDVESYPDGRSPYGANDMSGNVWEWASSQWAKDDKDPVVRGGSWNYNQHYAACAYRDDSPPDSRDDDIGFRCSRTKI